MKMVKKILVIFVISIVATSCVVAMASENVGNQTENIANSSVKFNGEKSSDFIEMESCDISDFSICETNLIPIDDNTYQVVTKDGEIIATTTVSTEIPYQNFTYCWHILAGQTKVGTTTVDSYKGMTIDYTVTFSRSGNSLAGLAVYDSKTIYTLHEGNNSFSSSATIQKDLGEVSFAIMNNCDHEITYSGTVDFT